MAEQGRRFYVTLASGRRVGVGDYARGVKVAIANPDATFREGLASAWPTTGAQIRRQFREGLQDRINTRGGLEIRDFKRLHTNQAAWRRRLTGQRHTWHGDDEDTYICDGCERAHGVPGADHWSYMGKGGYLPLQHLGRDRAGNGLIPWCDHPEHPRGTA